MTEKQDLFEAFEADYEAAQRVSETPGTEAGPVTAAGRALIENLVARFGGSALDTTSRELTINDVRRIEAEARAQRDAELRAAVAKLFRDTIQHYSLTFEPDDAAYMELDPPGYYVIAEEAESAVLALLHARADTPSREGGE